MHFPKSVHFTATVVVLTGVIVGVLGASRYIAPIGTSVAKPPAKKHRA